jgi:MFS family permease
MDNYDDLDDAHQKNEDERLLDLSIFEKRFNPETGRSDMNSILQKSAKTNLEESQDNHLHSPDTAEQHTRLSTNDVIYEVDNESSMKDDEEEDDENGDSQIQNETLVAVGLSFFCEAIDIVCTFAVALDFPNHQTNQSYRRWQSATIASSVFLGLISGSLLLPEFNDLASPRMILRMFMVIRPILGFSLSIVGSGSSSFTSMVMFRFLVGFLAASKILAVGILIEFPTQTRPSLWIYVQLFWSAGIIVATTVQSLTSPNSNLMILVCEGIIGISCFFSFLWLPESPMWQSHIHSEDSVLELSNSMASQIDTLPPNRSRYYQKWSMWGIWMGFGFLYYGSMQVWNSMSRKSNEYLATTMVSSEFELIGVFLGWYCIRYLGLRRTQLLGLSLGGFFVTLMVVSRGFSNAVILFTILSRLFLIMGSTAFLFYTVNTNMATPMSFCMVYIGGVQAPFLMDAPSFVSVVFLAFEVLSISLACFFLPEVPKRSNEHDVIRVFV